MYLPENLRQEFDLVASEVDTQRQRRNGKQAEKTPLARSDTRG